jgi:hypothetical protein
MVYTFGVRGVLAVVCLLVASTAHAQKPLGAYDCGDHPPTWATVCTLSDLDPPHVWAEAKALSVTRGIVWWLKVGYHNDPRVPIGAHAALVRARIDAYGLLPYIAGQSLGEEWHTQWVANAFAVYGFPATYPNGHRVIRDWLTYQHGELKRHIPVPVVWVTPVISDWDGAWPVPRNTDAVAMDPYMPRDGVWALDVESWLWRAEESTDLPLVLVAQWFDAPGYAKPRAEDVARYLSWLARPRWIALVAFTWRDRPGLDMTGMESLPALRAAVESAMGSR